MSSQTVNTNFLIVGIKLNLLNKEVYGYMVNPSDANQTLEDMKISFTHVKLEWFGKFSSNNNNDNRGLFATHPPCGSSTSQNQSFMLQKTKIK